jgi:hypothetical protein
MSQRYTLLLDDGAVRNVDRLQAAYQLKTRADVYQLATRVLTWITEQNANGREVGRFSNGDFQPLLMPHELDVEAWKAVGNGMAAV